MPEYIRKQGDTHVEKLRYRISRNWRAARVKKSIGEVLPQEQLWINPDCELKTRQWEEVKPSLENMVKAVEIVRGELAK